VIAARLHAYGRPPVVEEIPDPPPPRAREVVVRVAGAGLCRTDLHVLDGLFADVCRPLPYVMGHETAGRVHAVGTEVDGLAPGDPVIVHPFLTCGTCRWCRRGADNLCERFRFLGAMVDGGFAELVTTDARSVVRLGPSTDPAAIAGLADGGLTAYRAVKESLPWLPPGSTAVVVGAGGLGHLAVQLLRALSATRVVAVDRTERALDLAARLGADAVVPADGGHVAAVHAATDGLGAEVVLDFVGEEDTPMDAIRMLSRGGRYVAVGYGGRLDVATYDLVGREITVAGSLVGTHAELEELAVLAERGLVVVTGTTYPLAGVPDAMADLRAGRVEGRAVLLP
jgi:NAD+-dependent secondary alcohol dehydrogenase Adh1